VLGANGEKLSKQNGAAPLDLAQPSLALRNAAAALGLQAQAADAPTLLAECVAQWRAAAGPRAG